MNAFKSDKQQGEAITVGFDFAALTATPLAPVFDVSRAFGSPDADPASIKSGSPQVLGTTVLQRITGGAPGCTYRIQAQVDAPDGSRWIESALLAVK